jgi:hypothetical protein
LIFAFGHEYVLTSIGPRPRIINGLFRNVRSSPQTIVNSPYSTPRRRRNRGESRLARKSAPAETKTMKTERPEPNAELSQTFEPLRFVFAIGALLLGFVASLRF